MTAAAGRTRPQDDERRREIVRFYERMGRRSAAIIAGGIVFVALSAFTLTTGWHLGGAASILLATALVVWASRHRAELDRGPVRRAPTPAVASVRLRAAIDNHRAAHRCEQSARAVGRGEKTLVEHEADVHEWLREDDRRAVGQPRDPTHRTSR